MGVLTFVGVLPQVGAVLLLNLRPQSIIELTKRTCTRKLVHLAKTILAVCLVGDIWVRCIHLNVVFGYLVMPLSMLVLSIDSFQGLEDVPIVLLIDIGFLIYVVVNFLEKWLFLSSVQALFALFLVVKKTTGE